MSHDLGRMLPNPLPVEGDLTGLHPGDPRLPNPLAEWSGAVGTAPLYGVEKAGDLRDMGPRAHMADGDHPIQRLRPGHPRFTGSNKQGY